ncbi:DsbA family protein [Mesorhizobium delmotii]|uniref:DSBA oxidoreductase n=1 Tax=Mesorhizobium delmotii TaxID=1631247 RepID=A0A2P9ARA0_9HYPH|nr:DsbA family protein [Mesorhizobium delmotii]SJM33691.1 DSBA oxidoreductase [Mesorhizobium delmotii]
MNRRHFIAGASALAILSKPYTAVAASTPEQLLKPGPLPEQDFGSADAPVTVIEYASLTCPHCRTFHVEIWPAVKEKYVDTGKVRFIMREFPFDPRASGGFMLARCAGEDRWYPTVDLLYRTQDKWARVSDATSALKSIMGMTGMSGSAVEACLSDQALLDKITQVMLAGQVHGVDSTPTFFINGEMRKGALTIEQFSAIVDPMIAAAE